MLTLRKQVMERRKLMNKEEVLKHGLLAKGAEVRELSLTDDELTKINKYTLSPLTADDVYVFKIAVCNNDIDRHYERFTEDAIKEMAELFVGKPLIKDHERKADHQIGRIYDTEVIISETEKTSENESLYQLVAHCYVLHIDANKDLISEIKGGIKKEVSVGLRIGKMICNICGVDNTKEYCNHWWGREYDGVTCIFTLEDPVDAFEVSFVAVPAQAKAGTMKEHHEKHKEMPTEDESTETDSVEDELNMKLKSMTAFIYIQTQKREKEQ